MSATHDRPSIGAYRRQPTPWEQARRREESAAARVLPATLAQKEAIEAELEPDHDPEADAAFDLLVGSEQVEPDTDAGLWSARPWLRMVRQAAHARQRAPHAVLGATLARVAAGIPFTIKLPPIVGGSSPLCMFVLLIGPSGVGKGGCNIIARELLPLRQVYEIPSGSGEGLVEALFGMVEVDGKQERQQVRHNVSVYIDEGETVSALGQRSGSTLLPTMRSIWSGSSIGAANANKERTRLVPAGQYTYGVVIGLQPERAGALLSDASGGTPQRFLWTPTVDRFIPEEPPPWPGAMELQPPSNLHQHHELDPAGFMRHYMEVVKSVEQEIRRADLAVARGEISLDPLAAHGMLLRLRVAGLLALVERRMEVTEEDWQIAGLIKSSSDLTIASTQAVLERERHKAEDETAGRRTRVEARMADHRIVQCAERVREMVQSHPGVTRRELRQRLRAWRDVAAEGIDHAVGAGWIVEKDEPGQGRDPKRTLHPAS